MEEIAGDLGAAERELRSAIEVAEGMGAHRYELLYRTRLAHVLASLGRDAEALEELERAEESHGGTATWRTARARLLARAGETGAAVALARQALASIDGTDDITTRARELVWLAEVLRAAGDDVAAAAALEEAAALHDEKGNLLPAESCRELLRAVTARA
jgi:hypothetical protein